MNKTIKKILAAISLAFALSDCGPLPTTMWLSLSYYQEFSIAAPYLTVYHNPDSIYVGQIGHLTIRQYDTTGATSPTICMITARTRPVDPNNYNAYPNNADDVGNTTSGITVRIKLSEECPTLRPTTETLRAEIDGMGPTKGLTIAP